MRLFFHILRYKILAYLKGTFDAHSVSLIRGAASVCIFGGFAYGAYVFAFETTRFILERTHVGVYLFHTFISMALFVFFISVNLGNIIVSYSTLYRSSEVSFLFTKPVPYTSVFVLKFLDNFFHSSTTLFLGAFMVLLGYGSYFGHPWYFYAGAMFFVLIPFMFLSACFAVLILMAIMKLAGKIGFRSVMAGLFIFYLMFVFLFFESSNPISIVEKIGQTYPNVDEYLISSIPAYSRYLPNQWVAECLYSFSRGDISTTLQYIGILLLSTIIMFGIAILSANRFYYRSWLVSLHVHASRQNHRHPTKWRFLDFHSRSMFSPAAEVQIKKELLTFLREPSQWMHLLVMIILTALFSVSVSHLNLRIHITDIQMVTYLVLFAFGGFMVGALALRFVFPMIGMEGEAFWMLRTSPVKTGKIFLIKFCIGFVLVFSLAAYIAVSSALPFVRMTEMRPLLLWFGIFSAFWISLATVMLNLGLGALFANYSERNPIRAASTQGATLTFLVTLLYLLLMVTIVYVPISAYFATLFRFQYFSMQQIILPGTIFAVFSYLIAVAGLFIGLRSLRRDF